MRDPTEPAASHYLKATLIWLVAGTAVNMAFLRDPAVLLGSIPCALLGIGLFWFAISKADVRTRGGLVAIGTLAGLFGQTVVGLLVMYATRETDPWLAFLVPGCMAGGFAAGVYLSKMFPQPTAWWPAPPQH